MKAPPDIINTRNMKREKEEKRGCHSAARGALISLPLRILLLASKARQAYQEQACESPKYQVRLLRALLLASPPPLYVCYFASSAFLPL